MLHGFEIRTKVINEQNAKHKTCISYEELSNSSILFPIANKKKLKETRINYSSDNWKTTIG